MKQLFQAIRAGNAETVKTLLDENPQLVAATDDSGLPALTVAIYHHQRDIAALLESRGAPVDIFAAAMSGRVEQVKEAVAASPDAVNSFSADGWTPLHLAAFF